MLDFVITLNYRESQIIVVSLNCRFLIKTMDVIYVTGFLSEGYVYELKYFRHMLVLIITGVSCTAIRKLNYYPPSHP